MVYVESFRGGGYLVCLGKVRGAVSEKGVVWEVTTGALYFAQHS